MQNLKNKISAKEDKPPKYYSQREEPINKLAKHKQSRNIQNLTPSRILRSTQNETNQSSNYQSNQIMTLSSSKINSNYSTNCLSNCLSPSSNKDLQRTIVKKLINPKKYTKTSQNTVILNEKNSLQKNKILSEQQN